MRTWKKKCAKALLVPELSVDELFARTAALLNEIGFEFCCYTMEARIPVSAPRAVVKHNLDEPLRNLLDYHHARMVLPMSIHARVSSEVLMWPLDDWSREDAEFWQAIRDNGVLGGWTIGSRARTPTIGRLSAFRRGSEIEELERHDNLPKWMHITEVIDTAMRKRIQSTLVPLSTTVTLTSEERDVLCWAADGKTASETGDIMGMRERTVNYHRTNACLKVGSVNLIHGVIKAQAMGLLAKPVDRQ